MPGQLFHLAVLRYNAQQEESITEFIKGGMFVDCLIPIMGRKRSHFCLDEGGWDIPMNGNGDGVFLANYYGEVSESKNIVDSYPDILRVIAKYEPKTSFRRGVICHLLTDYFNQRIRFEENFDYRTYENQNKILIKKTGELLDKETLKKRFHRSYFAEGQYAAEICGLTERQVESVRNLLEKSCPTNIFNAVLSEELKIDKLSNFTSNEFVTAEQIVRIVTWVHKSMNSLRRDGWVIL